MPTINEQLGRLYERHWRALVQVKREHELSWPLLMSIDETYSRSEHKLFVVGQQTCGWGPDEDNSTAEELMQCYLEFQFGKNPNGRRHYTNTPFWKATRYLRDRLFGENLEGDEGIAWSNLLRMDQSKKRPNQVAEAEIRQFLPLLREEIKICKPNLVVFFTGPYYDSLIEGCFNVRLFLHENLNMSERILCPELNLPTGARTYRTYHPHFFVRLGKWNVLRNELTGLREGYRHAFVRIEEEAI